MAEDSGTFKTNPRNPSRFKRIVTIYQRRCQEVSGAGKHVFSDSRTFARRFFDNGARCLAVLTEPDSLHPRSRWLRLQGGILSLPCLPACCSARLPSRFRCWCLALGSVDAASGARPICLRYFLQGNEDELLGRRRARSTKSRGSGGDRRPLHLAPLGPGAI